MKKVISVKQMKIYRIEKFSYISNEYIIVLREIYNIKLCFEYKTYQFS